MSDPLSAYQPPLASNSLPPKPQLRPTSITVFGILNLAFAAMGLLGICLGVGSLLLLDGVSGSMPPNPVLEIMRESQGYRNFFIISMILGIIATIVLGCGGIGLLKMRSWGRQLSIVYGAYAIVAAIVGTIANIVWVFGPLMEKASSSGGGPEAAGAMGGAIGGTFGGCFGLIYPIVLLFFMFRPNIVEALQSE